MPSEKNIIEKINFVLDEMKALNIIQLDVRNKTSITDYMYICSGRSSRHVASIAEELFTQLKKMGLDYIRISGQDHGEWALIDCGDVIVHVMQPEVRAFYNLEELWQDVPLASKN